MNLNIITLDNKDITLKFAAKELECYLFQINPFLLRNQDKTEPISRIELGIKESLSMTDMPEIDDAYEISIENLNGTILGSNSRAVLIGVYQYLYKLGCRFLRPGKEYEVIPSFEKIEMFTVSCTKKAYLRHRGVCIEGADSFKNILDFIDWLPKLGFNSFFVQFQDPYSFLKRWYDHTNNPSLEKEPFDMKKAIPLFDSIDEALAKRGLLHHRVGHGWTSEAIGQPTHGWEQIKKPLKEEQTKKLALIDEKREYYHDIPANTNLCYSNKEVQKDFVTCVADYAQKHSEVNYLHVWLADEYNNHCECEACSRKTPTDWYIHLLNQLDEELEKRELKTKIVFLLYLELLWPPVQEKLLHPERFLLMFAPISRTFTSSYRDRKNVPALPPYKRNQIKLPNGLEENLSFLEAWQKLFNGDSFVYDYHLGRAHYGDPGYVSISEILYQDIHEIPKLGLNGYIGCQELRAALPNALPDYVMGLSLFDETLTFKEIEEDYFKYAYGNDWEECLKYLEELSSLHNCDYFNKIGDRKNDIIATNMEKVQQLLIERMDFLSKHQSSTSVQERFWDHLIYHNTYAIKLSAALRALSSGAKEEEVKVKWKEFVDFICCNEMKYQSCLDVYRVIEVGTNYTKFPKI